jgi:integrase
MDPDAFGRAFKRLAKAAGLPPTVRLHDLRHGVATALLAGGVHPAVTSAVLGHTSPAFTMKTYQHVVDGMTRQAADVMQRAIQG